MRGKVNCDLIMKFLLWNLLQFQSPCGEKWIATQETNRYWHLCQRCLVSIPLRGKVNCDFLMVLNRDTVEIIVSIPLRGKVNCDLKKLGGKIPKVNVSIPLRGKVNCDEDYGEQNDNIIFRFNPLAGKSELRLNTALTLNSILVMFQSPCGEKWIATATCSTRTPCVCAPRFQSPCGEKWIATEYLCSMYPKSEEFQSPCGEKWIATQWVTQMNSKKY